MSIHEERVVQPENLLRTLEANVDNKNMTDAAFREFVRNCMPIVKWTEEKK